MKTIILFGVKPPNKWQVLGFTLCLGMSGCVTRWVHPNFTKADYQRDSYECKRQSVGRDRLASKEFLERCLEARGYSKMGERNVRNEVPPLRSENGLMEYRRYLKAGSPKAFAIATDGSAFSWRSIPKSVGTQEVINAALSRCEERHGKPCQLYAVNNDVLYRKNE